MNEMVRSVSRHTKELRPTRKCNSCGTKQSVRYIIRMNIIENNSYRLKKLYLCDKCAKYIL